MTKFAAMTPYTADLSPFAPRIHTMKVTQDKIRDIIGQGGKTLRGIQADCGVKISVEDSGIVTIASSDGESLQKAKDIIKEGLSEYFLYTVEGRDTIPNGWAKRLPSFQTAGRHHLLLPPCQTPAGG